MDGLAYAVGSICFILLLNMVNADDDFHEKWRRKHSTVPLAAIIVPIFMAFMFMTGCIFFWIIWYRRRMRAMAMLQPSPCVPPPMGPAPVQGPMVSGAPTYAHSEEHPLIPGGSTSLTTLNTPQKGFQEGRSSPYPTNGYYCDQSTSLPQLPTEPMAPMPSAPPQPPPPYGN